MNPASSIELSSADWDILEVDSIIVKLQTVMADMYDIYTGFTTRFLEADTSNDDTSARIIERDIYFARWQYLVTVLHHYSGVLARFGGRVGNVSIPRWMLDTDQLRDQLARRQKSSTPVNGHTNGKHKPTSSSKSKVKKSKPKSFQHINGHSPQKPMLRQQMIRKEWRKLDPRTLNSDKLVVETVNAKIQENQVVAKQLAKTRKTT
ncbi:hypothetical protein BZG36_02974 [Bifiguratus adelaidae]|uniref:Uncharacterized protein n=1 Tax=Bifiguratus adelaidae TaxID=1938954 RepID=A0A261Y0R9_9FUNG|nr:hypothetical protein BZG36_02974 [Bifiguratus adelaidae]